MRIPVSLVVVLASISLADSATQTDWSGGPGVWGPVIEFGIDFYYDTMVAHYCNPPGDLSLRMVDDVIGHEVSEDFSVASSVWSADIDGDGDMDILGTSAGAHDVVWWENLDGSGTSWVEHMIDDLFICAESVCSADIDGDDDMDVIGGNADNEGYVAWWENLDGTGLFWAEHSVDLDFPYVQMVYPQDMDGDGDTDVLGASLSLDEVSWWENLDGTGTGWIKHLVDDSFPGGPRCVHSEDIDGDGDADVIGGAPDYVYWWENTDGAGTSWILHTIAENFDDVRSVCADDIDGDGDIDVVGAAEASGILDDVSWWENEDGLGTSWAKHVVDGDFWGGKSVFAGDFDSDGDMDIAGASCYEAEIAWWENLDGSGSAWRKHVQESSFGGAEAVHVGDINGDAHMDIVGAARISGWIRWWELVSYAPDGHLVSSVLDVECGPDWNTIDWLADLPAGTSVAFQVRSSSDPDSSSMGPWSDTLHVPCSLEGILTDWEQYVQYRAILETTDPDITPTLHDVTITWDPVGISGDPAPGSFELLPFHPNPTSGTPSACFSVAVESSVELIVFDLLGRLIRSFSWEGLSAGSHEVALGGFSSGIYICRMRVGEYTGVRRFIVLE